MRVSFLQVPKQIYSSNVFLIRGNHNALSDVNTLIDTGSDGSIIDEIEKINTGLGKNRLAQVFLTHSHFDHTGGLHRIKTAYNPIVYAYSNIKQEVDQLVTDQATIKMGDTDCNIIHVPDHSNDSICIICTEARIAFTGDIPILGLHHHKHYSTQYLYLLEEMIKHDIRLIYPGHGNAIHVSRSLLSETYNELT